MTTKEAPSLNNKLLGGVLAVVLAQGGLQASDTFRSPPATSAQVEHLQVRIDYLNALEQEELEKLDKLTAAVETTLAASDRILEMHDRVDSDGVYLWYVPRSWGEVQRETLDSLRQLLILQQETNRLLKSEKP